MHRRFRRTPAGRLRHSMQVHLASKVFRSDPLRKVSLASSHALAATTEEITVATAADLQLALCRKTDPVPCFMAASQAATTARRTSSAAGRRSQVIPGIQSAAKIETLRLWLPATSRPSIRIVGGLRHPKCGRDSFVGDQHFTHSCGEPFRIKRSLTSFTAAG